MLNNWDDLETAEVTKAIAWENCKKRVLSTIREAVESGRTWCVISNIGDFGEKMTLELQKKNYRAFVTDLYQLNIHW